ncbi:hypothetical protein UG55_108539 [Frankia sp. EI5c]|nr:hypothetical protein UG55_108539 [Frankia sp. EI5c]
MTGHLGPSGRGGCPEKCGASVAPGPPSTQPAVHADIGVVDGPGGTLVSGAGQPQAASTGAAVGRRTRSRHPAVVQRPDVDRSRSSGPRPRTNGWRPAPRTAGESMNSGHWTHGVVLCHAYTRPRLTSRMEQPSSTRVNLMLHLPVARCDVDLCEHCGNCSLKFIRYWTRNFRSQKRVLNYEYHPTEHRPSHNWSLWSGRTHRRLLLCGTRRSRADGDVDGLHNLLLCAGCLQWKSSRWRRYELRRRPPRRFSHVP